MNNTKTLTQGSILASLIKFALPVLAAMFLQSLYGGVDLLVVGQFAETADVSGVATGSQLMHTATLVVTSLAMGLTIYVGQKIGEKKEDEAGRAVGAGVVLFLIIGAVMTVVFAIFAARLSAVMQAPEEAFSHTTQYVRICGLGFIFITAYNVLGAIFRGIGDSATPLLTVAIACGFNIAGDIIFVAVLGLGAAGAAIATVLSQASSVVISLMIISRKKLPFRFSRSYISFDRRLISKELKLGVPIALQELLVGVSFLVIQAIVNSIDVVASAGVGVAEKVCAFILLVPSSFGQSMAAFVAQNVGARETVRAKKALIYGILTSLAVGLVIGSFTFVRGDLLAAIFSKDAAVIASAHSYLKAYAIDTLLTAIMFCWIGYYNGCGKTLFVMIQGIMGAIGVRVPMVFLMSRIEGASLFMIGLGTPSSTFVQILLCAGYAMWLKKQNNQLEHI